MNRQSTHTKLYCILDKDDQVTTLYPNSNLVHHHVITGMKSRHLDHAAITSQTPLVSAQDIVSDLVPIGTLAQP